MACDEWSEAQEEKLLEIQSFLAVGGDVACWLGLDSTTMAIHNGFKRFLALDGTLIVCADAIPYLPEGRAQNNAETKQGRQKRLNQISRRLKPMLAEKSLTNEEEGREEEFLPSQI